MRFSKEQAELLDHLVKVNPKEFNLNKCFEELSEFQEAIVKRQTKSQTNPRRPSLLEPIHEFGDVIYRGIVAVMHDTGFSLKDIDKMVQEHVDKKLAALQKWRENGEYHGGL